MSPKPISAGRPPAGGPVVAVSIDGRGVGWCDGHFSGDRQLAAAARRTAFLHTRTQLHPLGELVSAGDDSPAAAAAAMVAISPGRAQITDAPDEVWALFPPTELTDDSWS